MQETQFRVLSLYAVSKPQVVTESGFKTALMNHTELRAGSGV